jgi:hypothetical protein
MKRKGFTQQTGRVCVPPFQAQRPVVDSFGNTSLHKTELIISALNIMLFAAEIDRFTALFFVLSSN